MKKRHISQVIRINPIKSDTIQARVYDELLDGIICGRIPPGEKLTIEGLANALNVSLTPVRVAVQKLEAGGFVKIGKNRRVIVSELTKQNLLEIQEIRQILECHAAEVACQIRSEESLLEIERLYKACVDAPDEEAYLEANRAFHGVIYREAGKPILQEVLRSLWQRVSPYLHILLRSKQDWKSEKFARHHKGMLQAMQKKEPKAIRYWLTQDMTEAAKLIGGRLELERQKFFKR